MSEAQEKWFTLRLSEIQKDGLIALSHWLEGFEASGKGRVTGAFELITALRSLKEVKEEPVNPPPF